MKMRSIAFLAAVVAISIGTLSAALAPGVERERYIAGGTTGVVPRPISSAPISTVPGTMPGAGMPMTTGMPPMVGAPGMPMQRMPSYGYQQPLTAAEQLKLQAAGTLLGTGGKVVTDLAGVGTEALKLEVERKNRQLERQDKEEAERSKRQEQQANEAAITDKINKGTQPSINAAQDAYANARTQIKDLQKKMTEASSLGIDSSEYNDDLSEARKAFSDVRKDFVTADGILAKCLTDLDIKQIQLVNRAYVTAKDSAEGIDLSAASDALDAKIRAAKAEQAQAKKAARVSTRRPSISRGE